MRTFPAPPSSEDHPASIHRRAFLHRCGLLAAGGVLAASMLSPEGELWAAGVSAQSSRQMTSGDRALLRMLSAYSTDAYFWGSQVFARATGIPAPDGTTNLLVRVDDFSKLVAFFRSGAVKTLGRVAVSQDTLSFSYAGAAYTVTNKNADDFSCAVAAGGVMRDHLTGTGVFAHQAVLYHPATDTLRDPYLAVQGKHLDLVEKPTGGMSAQMRTLLQGWQEARQQGLDLGESFASFQKRLLAGQPTAKTASSVVLALLGDLPELAGAYNVDELGSLLRSPLISASLRTTLDLDADQIVSAVKALRNDPSLASYPDGALWLATLLPSQIEDGLAEEWLASSADDAAATAASQAALPLATQLVNLLTSQSTKK